MIALRMGLDENRFAFLPADEIDVQIITYREIVTPTRTIL
jgi:hypothetical protein